MGRSRTEWIGWSAAMSAMTLDATPVRGSVIETENLTKQYGPGLTAVDRLNLSITQGEVYGLLGPNGAGKTTTLRMLLGLVRPTSGRGSLLGMPLGAAHGLGRVGALIETPAFYPHLSGRTNLGLLATLAAVAPSRVTDVLRQVDLLDRADDRFGTYSLGMKQRLGVGAALLKDPQVLVLDEPTNGLDPQGRVDMRGLVQSLGRGARTVVVSSHLLEDVEQVCDRVGILQDGHLITETTVAELRGPRTLLVRATPIGHAREVLERRFGASRVSQDGDALLIDADPAAAVDAASSLAVAGVQVAELRPVQRSLEDAFLQLTGATANPSEAN